VGQLGANAHGEVLEPGRVSDCYVGLLLRVGDPDQAPSVLVVSPAAFLHPGVGQPDGTLVYQQSAGAAASPPLVPHGDPQARTSTPAHQAAGSVAGATAPV
jgi:hypothetical protein